MPHRHHILIFALLAIALFGCTTTSTHLSRTEKERMLEPLEAKINDLVGSDYGPLIIKMDLLELDNPAPVPDRCPFSPIYTALNQNISNASFEERVSLMERNFEEKSRNRAILLKTLYLNAHAKSRALIRSIRSAPLAPKEVKRNNAEPARYAALNQILAANDNDEASAPAEFQGGPFIPVSDIAETNWRSKLPFNLGGNVPASTRLEKQLSFLGSVSSVISGIPILTPLPGSHITGDFRVRKDPFNGRMAKHEGLDLKAEENARIYSPAEGRVVFSGRSGSYGNLIIIDHGLGISSRYAHLQTAFVQEGDAAYPGQILGIQGNTGRATGPHLHYEVRFNNKPQNPNNFLRLGTGCPL